MVAAAAVNEGSAFFHVVVVAVALAVAGLAVEASFVQTQTGLPQRTPLTGYCWCCVSLSWKPWSLLDGAPRRCHHHNRHHPRHI